MTEIMASIKPEWCELIASGKKTAEVRKSAPKETPFKAYIYETKGGKGTGKVIGEFVCDYVLDDKFPMIGTVDYQVYIESKMTVDQIVSYAQFKPVKAWHISNLKIYDNPLSIDDFYVTDNASVQSCRFRMKKMILGKNDDGLMYGKVGYWCCKNNSNCDKCWTIPLQRPPQSWCYVRSKSNE